MDLTHLNLYQKVIICKQQGLHIVTLPSVIHEKQYISN